MALPYPYLGVGIQPPMAGALGSINYPGADGASLDPGPAVGVLRYQRVQVPYLERFGESPVVRAGSDGLEITRTLYIPFTMWIECLKCLLGYPFVTRGKTAGWYISRMLAEPFGPNYYYGTRGGFDEPAPACWCMQANLSGIGCPQGEAPPGGSVTADPSSSKGSLYFNAKVEGRWTAPNWDIVADDAMPNDLNGNPDEASLFRFIERRSRPSIRYSTLPGGSFVYVSDGTLAKGTPGKLEITSSQSVIWHDVPEAAIPCGAVNPFMAQFEADGKTPYVGALDRALGCVNDAYFLGEPKGCLFLSAVVFTPKINLLLDRLYDVELMFDRFDARSRPNYPAPAGGQAGHSRGHNLILRTDAPDAKNNPGVGYDEIVAGSTLHWLAGLIAGTPGSNWLRNTSLDGVNLYNYFDMDQIFRVPLLTV